MIDTIHKLVYSRDTIEFVTVCVQYCAYLEELQEADKEETIDKLSKLLPLLYLKASLAPQTDMEGEDYLETSVTENDYDYIVSKLYTALGKDDAYLEVFVQDMQYSDTPISSSISENLTDIYQDIRNFITIYERGVTETMNNALCVCLDNFRQYWGQRLVNVLRALHMLKYTVDNDTPIEANNTDDTW